MIIGKPLTQLEDCCRTNTPFECAPFQWHWPGCSFPAKGIRMLGLENGRVSGRLWHRKPELTTAPQLTFGLDAPTMSLDNPLGDIQPQPAAGGVVFSLGPIAIEHMGQIVRCNAFTGVSHRKYNLLTVANGADADVALAWGELDRIADKVRQHLEQALRVGLDLQAGLDIERQVDAFFRGQGGQQRIDRKSV